MKNVKFDVSVVFCFIVMNGEAYLDRNLKRITNIGKHFRNFSLRYVENDSTDHTVEILNSHNILGKCLKIDGKYSTQLGNPGDEYNNNNRTRRLAYLRQIVLEDALTLNTNLLVMIDMDFVDFDDTVFIEMCQTLLSFPTMNGIFGMSVYKSDLNQPYDIGAISPGTRIPEILAQNIELVSVDSAFTVLIFKSGTNYHTVCKV